ncbi:hypothetical protein FPOA_04510 [Fusarium poae]|uniref:Uncharacterized protein n=1 Tax=Fusarium poae TaxID=36050 RepID=A0A1B8ATV5_FUSPO|nr:hypothetical protein FPOA_04510 [Fusarium poae]
MKSGLAPEKGEKCAAAHLTSASACHDGQDGEEEPAPPYSPKPCLCLQRLRKRQRQAGLGRASMARTVPPPEKISQNSAGRGVGCSFDNGLLGRARSWAWRKDICVSAGQDYLTTRRRGPNNTAANGWRSGENFAKCGGRVGTPPPQLCSLDYYNIVLS